MRLPLPLPPLLPDQSATSGGLSGANNVYPRTDGYGPISGFTALSAQLADSFAGGQSFIANDGTSYLLVGTDAGLVKYSGSSWTDLITAMTVPGHWRFAQFGNYVVAVNGVDTKVVDLALGTASALTDAPAGVCVTVVGDYVIIGQASGDILGVYTSGYNDHTNWDYVTSTATYQPMLTGGEVMGLSGGEYGIILQRQRLVRMSLTGDKTAPFQYDEISANVGCASKGSVAQFGNMTFFLSDSGFKMLLAGQELKAIGSEKVDRTFISQTSRDDWERIFTAIDPQSKVVMWCVPGAPAVLWIYNWELDRWSTASLALEGVFSGFTTSTDLDSLAVTYPNLDAMTISLDDPRWSGGNPKLYCVQSGYVGYFFGAKLKASFEFSFQQPNDGVSRYRAVRPVTDAASGITISMDCRARLGDGENITTVTDLRDSGIMPIRCSGRYAKIRWEIAAATSWSFAQGLELEFETGGRR